MYSPRTVVQFVGRKLCCIVDTAGSEEQKILGEDLRKVSSSQIIYSKTFETRYFILGVSSQGVRERARASNLLIGCCKRRSSK